MTLIEAQESNQRTFIKKRLEAMYARMKNGNSTEIKALNYRNPHFKQFSICYDKAKTEYHITNPLGNGCSFVLGTTYMSIYIDVKLYDLNYRYKLKSETEVPFFLYRLKAYEDVVSSSKIKVFVEKSAQK